MDLQEQNDRAEQRVERSDWLDRTARIGVVTYGLVHLLVAWLVLRLAFGDRAAPASGSGAFHELAGTALGRVTLYGVAIGFFALVVWQALEAAFGYRRASGRAKVLDRLLSAAKVVVFGVVGVDAIVVAAGGSGGSGGSSGTDGPTARLMRLPAGPWIVAAVGVVIIGIGFGLAYWGLSESFREILSTEGETGTSGRSAILLGTVGYVSKGVAIGLIGALFLYAALTHDPQKSGGLDQALHDVLRQPYGAPALVVMALGIACFGVYCFVLARHLDR